MYHVLHTLLFSSSQFFSFFSKKINWPISTSPSNQCGYLAGAQITTCPWSTHCMWRRPISSAARLSTCSASLHPRSTCSKQWSFKTINIRTFSRAKWKEPLSVKMLQKKKRNYKWFYSVSFLKDSCIYVNLTFHRTKNSKKSLLK